MRGAVETDDPRVVNHLVPDRDESRCLYDLIGVAVHAGNHRSRKTARDAACPEAEIFRSVQASGAGRPRESCAGVGLHRGNLAVRRIDHRPRSAAPAHFVDVAELGGVSDPPLRIAAQECASQLFMTAFASSEIFADERKCSGDDISV